MSEGFTLDAGALIAYERNNVFALSLLRRALERKLPLVIPAGVVGQVWRDGRVQARLAVFLASPAVEIEVLDDRRARAAGQLCGTTKTRDLIDASVVLCAKARRHTILTSDPDDLLKLDSKADLIVV